MEGVTVVTHPLVQHKLTLLRDKNRSTKSFRELCKEIGLPTGFLRNFTRNVIREIVVD
jgi:uracil phosphoribosyltransferase